MVCGLSGRKIVVAGGWLPDTGTSTGITEMLDIDTQTWSKREALYIVVHT